MDSSDLDTFDHLNTNQQEAFVSAVVEGANYREAAEQAGYSPGYGRRLAQKDHIQQAIQELREEAREESMDCWRRPSGLERTRPTRLASGHGSCWASTSACSTKRGESPTNR
jgi:hypothetical protein